MAPDSDAIGRVSNVLNVTAPFFSADMEVLESEFEDIAQLAVIPATRLRGASPVSQVGRSRRKRSGPT